MSYRVIQAGTTIERSEFPKDALFFFDFDGVLAEQCEDKLFRLPVQEGERARLEVIAKRHGIDAALYPDTGYLRHLVYQAYTLGRTPLAHMQMLVFMLRLEANYEPTFVVTARSGTSAVRRVLDYLDKHFLDPQEVFCLGRSSKAELLSLLRMDWPDRPFVFFEDSRRHLDECWALSDSDLHIVEVQWPACTENAEGLLAEMYEWSDA